MICNLVRREDRWDLYNSKGHKIASTKGHPKIGHTLSVGNCEAIENGYDLDELANDWVFEINGHKWSNNDDTAGDNCSSFKAGFQKAIELISDKKFSEEDMLNFGGFCCNNIDCFNDVDDLFKKYQPQKQTEWDVKVQMEIIDYGLDESCNPQYSRQPKVSKYGFLILKRV
jgi:hypothetical protein